MKKKYIIELEEPEMFDDRKFYTCSQMPWWALSENIVENLTPYVESDLEKVKKEAYDKGYMAAHVKSHIETRGSYQQGLNDAWEAARTLWNTTNRKEIFGYTTFNTVLMALTAQEAVEKIRQYEQEQNKIIKGDIVRMKGAPEIEIWVTDISDEDGGRLSGLALKSVRDNCEIGDTYAYREIHQFERTGRHYDVPTVLEKMGEDGNQNRIQETMSDDY